MTAPAVVVTEVRADGSATLSPADLVQVLGALDHAALFLADRAAQACEDCAAHPSGACEPHLSDLDATAEISAVLVRLGNVRAGAGLDAAGHPGPRGELERRAAAEVVAALAAGLEAADRLSGIRAVLAAFDWESGDLQYCLEQVDRIAAGECGGCLGRGTGDHCCLCGLPIPLALRRRPGDPSELPGGRPCAGCGQPRDAHMTPGSTELRCPDTAPGGAR